MFLTYRTDWLPSSSGHQRILVHTAMMVEGSYPERHMAYIEHRQRMPDDLTNGK